MFTPITSKDDQDDKFQKLLDRYMVIHHPEIYLMHRPGFIVIDGNQAVCGRYHFNGWFTIDKKKLEQYHFEAISKAA